MEFNVHDLVRAKAFYGAVFGWRFTDYGPDYAGFSTKGRTAGSPGTRPAAPAVP